MQEQIKSAAVIDDNTPYQTIDRFGFSSAWCGKLTIAKNFALYNTLGFLCYGFVLMKMNSGQKKLLTPGQLMQRVLWWVLK
jgi:hypothetical protein